MSTTPQQKRKKNLAFKLLKRDRMNSVTKRLKLAENKQSATWSMAHILMGSKKGGTDKKPTLKCCDDDSDSANTLNRFYVSKAAGLKAGADEKVETLVSGGMKVEDGEAYFGSTGFPPSEAALGGPLHRKTSHEKTEEHVGGGKRRRSSEHLEESM